MGQLFLWMFAPIAVLFLIAMSVLRAFQDRKADADLEPLAGLFDRGTVEYRGPAFFSMAVNRRVMGGMRGGRELLLWLEGPKHRRGHSRYRMYGYLVELSVAAPSSISFRAGRADWLTNLGSRLKLVQDLQSGEKELDEILRFSSSDPAAFARLAQRTSFLDSLREASRIPTFVELAGDGTSLRLLRRHDERGPLIDVASCTRVVGILERLREAIQDA